MNGHHLHILLPQGLCKQPITAQLHGCLMTVCAYCIWKMPCRHVGHCMHHKPTKSCMHPGGSRCALCEDSNHLIVNFSCLDVQPLCIGHKTVRPNCAHMTQARSCCLERLKAIGTCHNCIKERSTIQHEVLYSQSCTQDAILMCCAARHRQITTLKQ